jgi:hypothetical protein
MIAARQHSWLRAWRGSL